MKQIDIGKGSDKRTIAERNIYTSEIIRMLVAVAECSVLSYDEMSDALGFDVRPGAAGYYYQRSAREIVERDYAIAFEVVPTVGLKRLTPGQVASSSGAEYLKKKKVLISKSLRRISTVNDHFIALTADEQRKVTMHRTLLFFDRELAKGKNVRRIEAMVTENNRQLRFDETIKLFG